MKCYELLVCLFLGVVVLLAVGVVFFGLQSRESGSDTPSNDSLVATNTTNDNDDNPSLLEKNVTKESGDNSYLVDKNMTTVNDENSSIVDRKYVEVMEVNRENCSISDEKKPPTKKEYEKRLRFRLTFEKILKKLNNKTFELLLSNLSSFNDPDYKSDSGVKAAEWLISQLIQTIKNNIDYTGDVTIRQFPHSWKQPTVIVRFEGTDPALKSQLVLLGADLDTKYENNSTPGPGDNVGGSVVLLETTRVLLEANFIPKRSIELHWYASGEDREKQRGEIEIAQCYTRSGLNVISMVKFDTICYFLKDDRKPLGYKVNIATKKRLWESQVDKTDNALADFLVTVEETFVHWNDRVTNIRCRTDGCYSDNASWSAYGVNAAWPIVAPCKVYPEKYPQTILSNVRALNLAKFATVYATEIAEPKNVN